MNNHYYEIRLQRRFTETIIRTCPFSTTLFPLCSSSEPTHTHEHIRSFWIRRGKFSGVACSHKVDSWPSTRRGNDDRCPHYEYLSMELVGANKPSLSLSVNNEVPRRVASNLGNSDGKEVDDWPLHYLRRIKILLKFEPLWTMGFRAWGAREGSANWCDWTVMVLCPFGIYANSRLRDWYGNVKKFIGEWI